MRLPAPWMPLSLPSGGGGPGLPGDGARWRPLDVTGGSMLAEHVLLDVAAGVDHRGDESSASVITRLRPLDAAWSRIAVLRLGPGAHTPSMVDMEAASRERMRIVLAIEGQPALDVAGARIALRPGQAGALDGTRRHRYSNASGRDAFLLLADGAGSPALWDALSGQPVSGAPGVVRRERGLCGPPDPWQLRAVTAALAAGLNAMPPGHADLLHAYRAAWAAGEPEAALQALIDGWLARLGGADVAKLRLDNGIGLVDALRRQFATHPRTAGPHTDDPWFDRPVFVVSPPRAGSTLLFETLSKAPGVHTIGDESHQLIEGIDGLSPAAHGFASNRLLGEHATPLAAATLRARFMDNLHDRDGHRPDGWRRLRMLEKTPKNALRIPFLRRAFPEARFVYLYRDPRQVLASMMDAWESGRFRTYPGLPGWTGMPWSLLLVPGWRALAGRPLGQVVAHQWAETTRAMLDDLESLESGQWIGVDYARLLADPRVEIERICAWAGLGWDRPIGDALPLSRYTVSRPDPEKWRRRQAQVEAALAPFRDLAERAAAAVDGAARTAGPPR